MNGSKFYISSETRVLLVDDNSDNLEVLGNALKRHNIPVIIATSGRQAIEIAIVKKPQLILLDIQMPGMDGFEVFHELKKLKDFNNTAVIFLTAKTEYDDISKGYDMGAADYITKPFRLQELVQKVYTYLELSYLRENYLKSE